MTDRDNHYHEYDGRTPAHRQAERDALDAQVNEFLRSGGRIEVVSHQTIPQIKESFLQYTGRATEQNIKNAQKHKHQFLMNKEIAIENGKPTFIGLVCKKCGGSERWTKRGGCVKCAPEPTAADRTKVMHARKAASQADAPTYVGSACTFCGCTTRETITGKCADTWKHGAIRRASKAAKLEVAV
jgi:hypothetical protein